MDNLLFVITLGVIALIDVRSGGGGTENRSAVFSSKLHNLGATVSY